MGTLVFGSRWLIASDQAEPAMHFGEVFNAFKISLL